MVGFYFEQFNILFNPSSLLSYFFFKKQNKLIFLKSWEYCTVDRKGLKVKTQKDLKTYSFDEIDEGASLEGFFNKCVKANIEKFILGINLLIFVFSATYSGEYNFLNFIANNC